MKVVSFKEFVKDYRSYYNCKDVFIRDESDAEEVIEELYGTDKFEFDYENKTIELY